MWRAPPHSEHDLRHAPIRKEADAIAPVAAVQNRFFLFDRGSADVLAECENRGIAFVPYFPLAAGTELPHAAQRAALEAIAERHDATRAQTTLAWLLAHSPRSWPSPAPRIPSTWRRIWPPKTSSSPKRT